MAVVPKVMRRTCALAVLLVTVAAGCGDDADQVTTDDEATSTSSAPETAAPDTTDDVGADPATPADLEFRPVLQLLPPGGLPGEAGGTGDGCATPDEGWAMDQPVLAPQVENGEEVACYELGPAEIGGDSVESATAREEQVGGWTVALVLTSDGVASFNEVIGRCFEGAPACPTRQLAIVVDRSVLSAPSINAPEFERDAISISGGLTQAEAEALASRLG